MVISIASSRSYLFFIAKHLAGPECIIHSNDVFLIYEIGRNRFKKGKIFIE